MPTFQPVPTVRFPEQLGHERDSNNWSKNIPVDLDNTPTERTSHITFATAAAPSGSSRTPTELLAAAGASPIFLEGESGELADPLLRTAIERSSLGTRSLDEHALRWLLDPQNPSVRYQTLVDVLNYAPESEEAVWARNLIPRHPVVKRIMSGQSKAGFWPRRNTCDSPRFTGALWALTLLSEMGIVPDPRVKKECERFFDLHQAENGAFTYRSRLSGKKPYYEPCLTGNMVRTLFVLGYGKDSRLRKAIEWLPEAQLEDGGWNCDYPQFEGKRVRHSSFMSTIAPLWGYSEIPRQEWTKRMKRSMERGAEFILMHRLYKADHHEWMTMNPTFTMLHFPMYYYYDVLHGLRVLTKLGYGDDERMRDAACLVMSKRRPDGKWILEGDWFREPDTTTRWLKSKNGKKSSGPVDPWGNSMAGAAKFEAEPVGKLSKWITLNCYRALTETGDLASPKK